MDFASFNSKFASFYLNENKLPSIRISKNDSKYLSKIQIKKAQFLFENDYFIWNEAEMYLRYYEYFSTISDSDILYENICKTTRVIFNLIHQANFFEDNSNVAHLKFYEVLDAWGSLSLYIKEHDNFPAPFIEWFYSIFKIYQTKDKYGNTIASFECFNRLFKICGVDKKSTVEAYNLITLNNTISLSFERIIYLLKNIVISDELNHFSYLLVPNLKIYLLIDKTEVQPERVLRNYDYELNNFNSKSSDWKSLNELYSDRNSYKENSDNTNSKEIFENKEKNLIIYDFNCLKKLQLLQQPFKDRVKCEIQGENCQKQNIKLKNNDRKSIHNNYYSKTISSKFYNNILSSEESLNKLDISDKIFSNQSLSCYDKANSELINLNNDKNIKDFYLNMKPLTENNKSEVELKSSFIMSEFKREFKRNDLKKKKSKSINMINLIGSEFTSNFSQRLSSSSSNLKNFHHNSKSFKSDSLNSIDKHRENFYKSDQKNISRSDTIRFDIKTEMSNYSSKKIKSLLSSSSSSSSPPSSSCDESKKTNKISNSSSNLSKISSNSKKYYNQNIQKNTYKSSNVLTTSCSSNEINNSFSKLTNLNYINSSYHDNNRNLNLLKNIDFLSANYLKACSQNKIKKQKSSKFKNFTDIDILKRNKNDLKKNSKSNDAAKRSSSAKFNQYLNNSLNPKPNHNLNFLHHQYHKPKHFKSNKNHYYSMNTIDQNTYLKRNHLEDLETKSERYINAKRNESKNTHSYGLSSEPIKPISKTFTTSSLDTLNDIDSEESDEENLHELDTEMIIREIENQLNDNNFQDKIDTDWSYSIISQSSNEKKLITEIIKRLKPYIMKYVRKEVDKYFEKWKLKRDYKQTSVNSFQKIYSNSSLTKIGDF